MNLDWGNNNWELYFGLGAALFTMLMIFFKQEFESRRKADTKKDNPNKNKDKSAAGNRTDISAGHRQVRKER